MRVLKIIMGLKEILEKLIGVQSEEAVAKEGEDFVRVALEDEYSYAEAPERYLSVHRLRGFSEIDACVSQVSDGNIVIIDIRPLASRSMRELKQAVDEMREICASMGADLAGLGDTHLIITPPSIKIQKTRPSEFEEAVSRIRSRTTS